MKKLLLAVAGILFLLPFTTEAQKSKKKKPNIIFIMSDDHAYQAISAYDDKLLNTPNIDPKPMTFSRFADQTCP